MDAPFPTEMMPEIERFFREDHPKNLETKRQVPECLLYHRVFQSSLFFPLQRQTELYRMLEIANSLHPRTIMEIGADKGGGLYHWCMLDSVRSVIACEIRGLPYRHLFEQAFPHISFTWIDGSSYDPGNREKVRLSIALDPITPHGKGIDVLFIDGDKTAFRTDFDTYYPLMSRPSVVFLHDINADAPADYDNPRTPRGAYESIFRNNYRCSEFVDLTNTHEALDRARRGVVSASPHEGWLRFWKGRSCGVGIVRLV